MPFRYANLRYRTDPQRLSRILPPGLEPASSPDVSVDFLVIDFGDAKSVFFPAPYHESAVWVRCSYEGEEGSFLATMPLDGDWGRTAGRETLALSKKDAEVGIEREGERVHAWLRRKGVEVYRLDSAVTEHPAPEVDWLRENRGGGFGLRFRLNPDWRKGLFRDGPVDLVRLGAGSAEPPSDEPREGERVPRALTLAPDDFAFGPPSVLDPWCELPVVEPLGGSYYEDLGFDYNFGSRRKAREGPPVALLRTYDDPSALEPWALWGYDRPIVAGRPVQPAGWPETASAVTLNPDDLAAYRDRDALRLEADAVEVTLRVGADAHAAVVPDGVEAGDQPEVRIIALDVDRSDLSTVGFAELWLLARCALDGRPAWYALSHIVGSDGDVLYGREVFGHPSKLGRVTIERGDDGVRVSSDRLCRTFAEVTVGAPNGPSVDVDELADVVGVQADPFSTPAPVAGRLVAQPWRVTGRVASIDPSAVSVRFSAEPGPAGVGVPDPWFELDGEVVGARVGRVLVERLPGREVREMDDVWPLYRERCDGTWSGRKILEPAKPTFRLR